MFDKLSEEFQKPIVKYGLIVTALLVLIRNIVVPWFEWRQHMTDDLKIKSGLVIDRSLLEIALIDLEGKSQELKSDLDSISLSFSKEKNANTKVELPTQVRQLCESFDIKVNRISVTELESKIHDVESFMISLEAEGSVDRLFKLVDKLENDKAFFMLDRMTIYSRHGQEMKVRMELQKYVETK